MWSSAPPHVSAKVALRRAESTRARPRKDASTAYAEPIATQMKISRHGLTPAADERTASIAQVVGIAYDSGCSQSGRAATGTTNPHSSQPGYSSAAPSDHDAR